MYLLFSRGEHLNALAGVQCCSRNHERKNKNYYEKKRHPAEMTFDWRFESRPQKGIKSTFPKGKNETDAEFFNLVVHYLVTITSLGCP